jgi:DNA repair exonuclease SbcCD ATPase subunit
MFHVKAENFLAYQQLDFDFSNRGLVLIEGQNKDENLYKSNGSGKTSLVDALCWGLYGKCVKAASPDKVVNLKAGKNCIVEVEWGHYRVIRYRKHTKYKNDVHFYINDEAVNAKSVAETQARIDKELGLSYDSFVKSVYFQQSTLASFANAKDSEQKAIIEDILNLKLLGNAQEWCKERAKHVVSEIEKRTSNKSQLDLLLRESQKRADGLEQRSTMWHTDIHNQKCALWSQISELEKKKLEFKSDFDFERARSVIQAAQPLGQEFLPIQTKIYALQDRKTAITASKSKMEWQLNSLKERQLQYLADAESCRNKAQNCPTCGREMDYSIQAKLLTGIEDKIKNTKQDILDLQARFEKSEDPASLEQEIEELKAELGNKQNIISLAGEVQRRLEREEKLAQEASLFEERIRQAGARVTELAEQQDPYREQITEEFDKQQSLALNLQAVDKVISELSEEVSYYEYWVDGFSNSRLKSYIMDSITPYLNERANHYAQFLTGGAFQIDISTQTTLKTGELRDKFAVNLISQSGADYDSASGGEKKRIDIAILLALQDLVRSRANMPINLAILDEIAENIDSVGVERMVELLQHIATTQGSCFYITHNEEMKVLFPSVVCVVKENGVSQVIE